MKLSSDLSWVSANPKRLWPAPLPQKALRNSLWFLIWLRTLLYEILTTAVAQDVIFGPLFSKEVLSSPIALSTINIAGTPQGRSLARLLCEFRFNIQLHTFRLGLWKASQTSHIPKTNFLSFAPIFRFSVSSTSVHRAAHILDSSHLLGSASLFRAIQQCLTVLPQNAPQIGLFLSLTSVNSLVQAPSYLTWTV